jgi:hypothetical protein
MNKKRERVRSKEERGERTSEIQKCKEAKIERRNIENRKRNMYKEVREREN